MASNLDASGPPPFIPQGLPGPPALAIRHRDDIQSKRNQSSIVLAGVKRLSDPPGITTWLKSFTPLPLHLHLFRSPQAATPSTSLAFLQGANPFLFSVVLVSSLWLPSPPSQARFSSISLSSPSKAVFHDLNPLSSLSCAPSPRKSKEKPLLVEFSGCEPQNSASREALPDPPRSAKVRPVLSLPFYIVTFVDL